MPALRYYPEKKMNLPAAYKCMSNKNVILTKLSHTPRVRDTILFTTSCYNIKSQIGCY